MKKIKIVSCLIVLLSLIVGVCWLYNKEDYNYYLIMGDYVSNSQKFDDKQVVSFTDMLGEYLLKNNKVKEVNSSYLKNNMTSKSLLSMIEKDAYTVDNSSLVKLIQKSKYITITLGINDVLNQIKYDKQQKKLKYDKDVVMQKIDVFKHNYHQILEEISDINKDAKVLLVGCYSIYGDSDLSGLINEAVKEVSLDGGYYVDVGNLDGYLYQQNGLYLTDMGQEMMYKKVVNFVNQIE